ncbi:hypothetical protein [Nocardia africana]|uniref:Uncharacterized protein n=1 Tax=Nocardia africana TaxID=134964 RepID=A0A378X3E8_9NOCA|nr:hypothetical protein [Nocardia africana]MCC3311477.1 hypothetical protein [Nocardia africana]SUA47264.1 Uncharacterised protein [Nocardia africana]
MSQHVIYAYDPNAVPQWAYSSFPIGCFGVADDLDEARAEYGDAMKLVAEDFGAIPKSIEHVEQRHPLGVWIRVRADASGAERQSAAKALWETISARGIEAATELGRFSRTGTGEPTVIVCLPSDLIGSVVDEIDEGESFTTALVYPDPQNRRDLIWVSGLGRIDIDDEPVELIDQAGLTLKSTMEDFMRSSGMTPDRLASGEHVGPTALLVPA